MQTQTPVDKQLVQNKHIFNNCYTGFITKVVQKPSYYNDKFYIHFGGSILNK
jgi:hypothetical protein